MARSLSSDMLKDLWDNDRQAKQYAAVRNFNGGGTVKVNGVNFQLVFDFFGDEKHYELMKNSELAHKRSALAGVVNEFEQLPEVRNFFVKAVGNEPARFHQAIGVVVKLVMLKLCVIAGWEATGWETTGRKGSLGTRVRIPPRTKTPGAYRNKEGSLSEWFTRAERYQKK